MHAGSGAVNRAYPREACEQQFEILRVGEDDQTPNGVACPNVGRGAAPTEGSSIGPRLGARLGLADRSMTKILFLREIC